MSATYKLATRASAHRCRKRQLHRLQGRNPGAGRRDPAAASRRSDVRSCSFRHRPGARWSFGGRDLASLDAQTLRRTRTQLHMIFQDPMSSLNPRRKVRDIVAEPMAIAGVGTAGGARAPCPHRARNGRPRSGSGDGSPPARVFRRPVPAYRDCTRADHGAATGRLRRTGFGARRLDPRADPQPAGGYEGALWPDAAVHQP